MAELPLLRQLAAQAGHLPALRRVLVMGEEGALRQRWPLLLRFMRVTEPWRAAGSVQQSGR